MSEKQFPYIVYHLDRDRLELLERTGQRDQRMVQLYMAMLSNAPRIGEGELEEYKAAASKERMKRKCESCLGLIELGLYQKVCAIDVKCAVDAIEMTNDINDVWHLKKRKNIEIYTSNPRSTMHYDVIERFGKPFLCMPLGFIDLGEQAYASGIV